jgi:hypothetical protein
MGPENTPYFFADPRAGRPIGGAKFGLEIQPKCLPNDRRTTGQYGPKNSA